MQRLVEFRNLFGNFNTHFALPSPRKPSLTVNPGIQEWNEHTYRYPALVIDKH